jgi:hypothetical protein
MLIKDFSVGDYFLDTDGDAQAIVEGGGMQPTNYKAQGFKNRRAYLESLCEEYPRSMVFALASMLGESEDFDGLVTSLEDAAEEYDFE